MNWWPEFEHIRASIHNRNSTSLLLKGLILSLSLLRIPFLIPLLLSKGNIITCLFLSASTVIRSVTMLLIAATREVVPLNYSVDIARKMIIWLKIIKLIHHVPTIWPLPLLLPIFLILLMVPLFIYLLTSSDNLLKVFMLQAVSLSRLLLRLYVRVPLITWLVTWQPLLPPKLFSSPTLSLC